jgi:hypothetical protein
MCLTRETALKYLYEPFRALNHRHDYGIGWAGVQDSVARVRSREVSASAAKMAEVVPERAIKSCSPQVSWKDLAFFPSVEPQLLEPFLPSRTSN